MAVGGVFKHHTTNHQKMKQKRKQHESAFKARVALKAIKGSKIISEIAGEFGIHPGQVADWKKTLADGGRECVIVRGDGLGLAQGARLGGEQHDGRGTLPDGPGACAAGGGRMDNVFIERLWRSVQYEDIYRRKYATIDDLISGLARWFFDYNEWRPHATFGGSTPAKIYAQKPPARDSQTELKTAT